MYTLFVEANAQIAIYEKKFPTVNISSAKIKYDANFNCINYDTLTDEIRALEITKKELQHHAEFLSKTIFKKNHNLVNE